jgi:hypothetical protein
LHEAGRFDGALKQVLPPDMAAYIALWTTSHNALDAIEVVNATKAAVHSSFMGLKRANLFFLKVATERFKQLVDELTNE